MNSLYEATRRDLIDKSKDADIVKSYKTTRYERRNVVRIYDAVAAFNRIDCNALFRANLLSFKIPVHGETDNYEIEVLFEGICDSIEREIKANDYIFEYKCVYKALLSAIDAKDIFIACTCPDWNFRFSYWATKGQYNGGRPEIRVADITNPNNSKGAGCKHVLSVLSNLDWALKLATSVYNYIVYMEEHFNDKFTRIIFPAIYGMSYHTAQVKGIVQDDELANTMDNEEDIEIIDNANIEGEQEEPEIEEEE